MRQRSRETDPLEDPPAESDRHAGPASDALNAAIERCADGDRGGVDELRAWEDGRLRTMLVRMLGDPALAESVLEAALDDVYRNAGMLLAVGQGPSDDRLFALVRRHAYAALRSREQPVRWPPPVSLRAVSPPEPVLPPLPPSPRAPAAPADSDPPPRSPLPTESVEEPVERAPLALGVATRLPEPAPLRRPGLRDEVEDFEEIDDSEPRRGRWLLALLAWIGAGFVGFALAVLAAGWLMVEEPPPPASPPVAAPEPPQAAAPPAINPGPTAAPPAPTVSELLGRPLEATEPTILPIPPAPRVIPPPPAAPRPATPPPAALSAPEPTSREAAAPPAPEPATREAAAPVAPGPAAPPAEAVDRNPGAESAIPDSARVFIHHSAGDAAAAGRARALAQRLQQRGASVVIVRPVPFGIRGLSVRYFHGEDRAAALSVLADAASFGGRTDGVRPTDFTAFQPAPRSGTIEIWLPGGT